MGNVGPLERLVWDHRVCQIQNLGTRSRSFLFLSLAFLLSLHVRIAWLASARIFSNMGAYYDEIEIEDMVWDAEKRLYHYPCPCGDRFEISRQQLANYEDIATCPSCSLIIRVIYDPVS